MRAIFRLFQRGEKIVNEAKKAVPQKPLTRVSTDIVNGVERLERPFMINGEQALVISETRTLEDGSKQIFTRIEGTPIKRTKNIKREEGASVFGGDRITVTKDDNHSLGYTDTMVKEYSNRGLEHIDYTIQCKNGNFTSMHVTQDKVFDNVNLNLSHDTLFARPTDIDGFMQTRQCVSEGWVISNYSKFSIGKSNYEMALEKKAAEAAKVAEEMAAAEAAAKAAAEKTAAELAAKLPRVNTHKLIGRDISEFRRIEKTAADGSITRYYFLEGSNKPAIKTFDHNGIHEEWVYRGHNFDSMHSRFEGDGAEFIEMKMGKVSNIFKSKPEYKVNQNGEKYFICNSIENTQTYNDGLIQVCETGDNIYKGSIQLTMPDGSTINAKLTGGRDRGLKVCWHEDLYHEWCRRGNPGKIQMNIESGGMLEKCQRYLDEIDERLGEVYREMVSKQVDLKNLYKPFEP